MGKNLEWLGDAIMLKFGAEMLGWRNNEIGIVGMVYHEGPHFGFGDGVGEIIVAVDFDGVWDVPRMKPI